MLLQRRNEECYAPVIQILKYLVNPDLKEGSGSALAVQGGLPATAVDEAKAGILKVSILLVCSVFAARGHALALATWNVPHVHEYIFHRSCRTRDAQLIYSWHKELHVREWLILALCFSCKIQCAILQQMH